MIAGRSDRGERDRDRRKLREFGLHLAGYFVVMAVPVAVNLLTSPENLWFVWLMVGWGSILAFHAAYAMGLFGSGAS